MLSIIDLCITFLIPFIPLSCVFLFYQGALIDRVVNYSLRNGYFQAYPLFLYYSDLDGTRIHDPNICCNYF